MTPLIFLLALLLVILHHCPLWVVVLITALHVTGWLIARHNRDQRRRKGGTTR